MTLPIVARPQALTDIEEIADYLGQSSFKSALRFVDRIENAFNLLSEFPEIGHKWSSRQVRLAGVRFWIPKGFKRYVVFYRPTTEFVEVIRVLHGSRDLAAILFGELEQ